MKSQTKGGASHEVCYLRHFKHQKIALATHLLIQQARKIHRSLRKYSLKKRRSRQSLEIKMLIIGSGGVGKTAMVTWYGSGDFITKYDSTIEDFYRKEVATTVHVGDSTYGISVILKMVEAAGMRETERYIRVADIVLICYSIINRTTFQEVTRLSQLAQSLETPYIIIGLKKDFRNSDSQMVQVSPGEGRELAHQLQAEGYFECSAKTGEGVDEVFNAAIQIGVQNELKKLKKESKCALS